jgi:hypothetical protein
MTGFADYLNTQPLWQKGERVVINISKAVGQSNIARSLDCTAPRKKALPASL